MGKIKDLIKNRKRLTDKQKELLLVIGGGALGGLLMATGYQWGEKRATLQLQNGIDQLWGFDPTLKDHMWEAMDKYNSTMK